MIDADGFRANVGIILANTQGQVLWAKRVGHESWQFPQGGIDQGETPIDAMYRELYEEVGLEPHHVDLLAVTNDWLRYRLPKRFVRHGQLPLCIGQKQKWFLLRLDEPNTQYIRFDSDRNARPEFDHWEWVSYWYPLGQVVHFKRGVYRRALQELAHRVPLEPKLTVGYQQSNSYTTKPSLTTQPPANDSSANAPTLVAGGDIVADVLIGQSSPAHTPSQSKPPQATTSIHTKTVLTPMRLGPRRLVTLSKMQVTSRQFTARIITPRDEKKQLQGLILPLR